MKNSSQYFPRVGALYRKGGIGLSASVPAEKGSLSLGFQGLAEKPRGTLDTEGCGSGVSDFLSSLAL